MKARRWRQAAKTALTDKVKPTYERVIAWLETDKPNASAQSQGVWDR